MSAIRNLLGITIALFISCEPLKQSELSGIWSLDHVHVDGLNKTYNPTFIEIQPDNRFALSTISGDLVGLYKLKGEELTLQSNDLRWFNTSWKVTKMPNNIMLTGLEEGFRTTYLKFVKIEKIPDFQSFENKIVGKWKIYKIRTEGKIAKLNNTWFSLDNHNNYTISDGDSLLEHGQAIVDTRHRKIIFENEDTSWKAWFYGNELRLDNEKLDMQYSLRK